MAKGGQLVMPAKVTGNGREGAIYAGAANMEQQQALIHQYGGNPETVTVPTFSGNPAANAASVSGNTTSVDASIQSAGDCYATNTCGNLTGGKRRKKSRKVSKKSKKSKKNKERYRKVSRKKPRKGGRGCNGNHECKSNLCNMGVKPLNPWKKGTCLRH